MQDACIDLVSSSVGANPAFELLGAIEAVILEQNDSFQRSKLSKVWAIHRSICPDLDLSCSISQMNDVLFLLQSSHEVQINLQLHHEVTKLLTAGPRITARCAIESPIPFVQYCFALCICQITWNLMDIGHRTPSSPSHLSPTSANHNPIRFRLNSNTAQLLHKDRTTSNYAPSRCSEIAGWGKERSASSDFGKLDC